MIERYEPSRRAMSLRQMMDRLFEDAFIMPGELPTWQLGGPALDVYEEGDKLCVEAQLPGLKPDEVEVTVDGDMLTIRGETKAEEEKKGRNYIVREQRRGSFVRSVRLPETVDLNVSEANFNEGVLRLSFPKTKEARPRRIPIKAGGQQQQIKGAQGSEKAA